MKSILEAGDLKGKKVLVRVDWNVSIPRAMSVVDDTRIVRTRETIQWLVEKGARQVVLVSHVGKAEEKKSIRAVAELAEKVLKREIEVFDNWDKVPENKIVILENVRLFPGEDKNDPEFAKKLAGLGEAFVNEAFGECHRKSASMVGVTKLLPSYAGFNLVKEVEVLTQLIENPKRPLVVIMGGSKVEDKIKLLEVISHKADTILLGGKLANEFVDQKMKLLGQAKVITPVEGSGLLDIGEETRRLFAREIAKAGTVVWNGPMGKVEEPQYLAGTHAVYEALTANLPAMVVVGGGDTLASIHEEKHLSRIDFVSTGGGAMLKLLQDGDLVGLEPLKV